MRRLVGIFSATGWFLMISAAWLGAIGLTATFLLRNRFAFDPISQSAWQSLALGFEQGGSIPLGFILICLTVVSLGLIGEAALLWRLPAVIAGLPSISLPDLSFRLPALRRRRTRPNQHPRAETVKHPRPPSASTTPAPAPVPPPAPGSRASAPAPEKPVKPGDDAILARILALFEVWNEPPPSWMAEALRDEVELLSPDAWPTLETLGDQGLQLLLTLQAHGMLPESPTALRAIGVVQSSLRAGLAIDLEQGRTQTAPPALTLAASWLCEALENFLAAQKEGNAEPERLAMAQTMLEQAMRGMGDADWSSLDLFPEKAGRVRVLTDRVREDLRRGKTLPQVAGAAMVAPVLSALDPIISLLEQFGFTLEDGGRGLGAIPVLARRNDLVLLLRSVDLKGQRWKMPQGPLGPWSAGDQIGEHSPGRQLWQQMARWRLRRADARPLAGLLVLHGGQIENEAALAEIATAERHRSGLALAWLDDFPGALPSLRHELSALPAWVTRDHLRTHSSEHASAQP